MIEAVIGAAVGVLTIVVARAVRGQRWMYAIGLMVLPGLYLIFAMNAHDPAVIEKEIVFGMPYYVAGLVFAFFSIRHSAVLVGAFWIIHGAWDMVHSQFFANPGVPAWYPVWCCAVDVVIGVYLLWLSRRIPDGNLRRA